MLAWGPGLAVQGMVTTSGSGARLPGYESCFRKIAFIIFHFFHLENGGDFNLPCRVAVKINEIMPVKQRLHFITIPHSGHPWG